MSAGRFFSLNPFRYSLRRLPAHAVSEGTLKVTLCSPVGKVVFSSCFFSKPCCRAVRVVLGSGSRCVAYAEGKLSPWALHPAARMVLEARPRPSPSRCSGVLFPPLSCRKAVWLWTLSRVRVGSGSAPGSLPFLPVRKEWVCEAGRRGGCRPGFPGQRR